MNCSDCNNIEKNSLILYLKYDGLIEQIFFKKIGFGLKQIFIHSQTLPFTINSTNEIILQSKNLTGEFPLKNLRKW
jgi:hypothetical protein